MCLGQVALSHGLGSDVSEWEDAKPGPARAA